MKRIDARTLLIPTSLAGAVVALFLAVACCMSLPAGAMAADKTAGHTNVAVHATYALDVQSTNFTYKHDPRKNPSAMKDIVEDEDAVYGFAPSTTGSLKDYASGDWTDPATVEAGRKQRIAYHESFKQMYDLFDEMTEQGASTEQIARAVSNKRNELRLAAYENDPEGLKMAKQRNLEEYGDENGGTPDFFYKKYGSWETVIEKSFSVNSGMDACLGLYDDYYELYVAAGQVPKLANTIAVKPAKLAHKLTYKDVERALQTSQLYKVKNACGEVTYKKKAGNKGLKVERDGTVIVKAGQHAGLYRLIVKVSAAGDAVHKPGSTYVIFAVKVLKAKNKLAVKAEPQTVKRCEVKKKAQVVAPIKVKKKNGKLLFKVAEWITPNAKKHIKLDSKTGEVTGKKGTCKGTYKFKVKVVAKGTGNYKKGVKVVGVRVKVE